MNATVEQDLVLVEGRLGTAVFSKDRKYRYRLTRRCGAGIGVIYWVMLNPSTATADENDLTITKCIGFSARLKASALVVVNLFAYRATHPKELLAAGDAVGPANLGFIREAAAADRVMAAWGAFSRKLLPKAEPVLAVLKAGRRLECLARTKDGAPKHPSRLGYAVQPVTWS